MHLAYAVEQATERLRHAEDEWSPPKPNTDETRKRDGWAAVSLLFRELESKRRHDEFVVDSVMAE